MNRAYLLLGSNRNNPKKMISEAESLISEKLGSIMVLSSLYRTAAWGNTEQPDFINRIILINTPLSPRLLMEKILEIEKSMGRVRTVKNAPRIIDIDILFYNNHVINEEGLSLPHPAIAERRFVLVPLHEIAPDLIHPVSCKSTSEMLRDCPDLLAVDKI